MAHTDSPSPRSPRAALVALGTSVAAAVLVFGWLVWSTQQSYQRNAEARSPALQVQELAGRIQLLDERMTTAALMAASGDAGTWPRRHAAARQELDRALQSAVALAPRAAAALPLAKAQAARGDLTKTEAAAIDSASAGRREAAAAMLVTTNYSASRSAFNDAIGALVARLESELALGLAAERRLAALSLLGGSAVLLLLISAAGAALYSLLKWRGALAVSVADCERAESTLKKSEEYHRIFRHANDVILILDPVKNCVVDLNHKACEVYDIPREMFLGRPLSSITHDTKNMEQRLRNLLGGSSTQEFETAHFRADGTPIQFLVTASLIEFQGGRAVLSLHRDITERKALEQQLAHQAFHDSLTGLANRALFRDRVEHAVARGRRNPEPVVVLFLDLDNFKTVNDSLGHAAGDQLLVQVSQRLRSCLRVCDTIARLGGDEFAILLQDAKHPDDSIQVAERITAKLRMSFTLERKEVFVGTSIGIATSERSDTAEELLRNADVAMYIAKEKGKGCFEIFDPAMLSVVMERLDLEADLRRALEREEFELYYQPIIDLASGEMTGAEALLRWNHPDRGVLAPGAFIPLAEETGMIIELGNWVLQEACRHARQWKAYRRRKLPLSITVNLSGRQLQQASIVENVALALAQAGLDPQALVLEVTESMMMQNTEATLIKLQDLRALGVRMAIDDFGTGYSSLSYLQRFPVDILKIDKSFIDGLREEDGESALARAIIALGETLGLRTVAEGVEVEEQAAWLIEQGCHMAQGYHFARPMNRQAFEELLQAGVSLPNQAAAAASRQLGRLPAVA